MKKAFVLLTIIVIFAVFPTVSSAEKSADKYISEFDDIVPDSISEDLKSAEGVQEALGLDGLVSEIVQCIKKEKGQILGFFMTLLGALVLLSLSSSVTGACGAVTSASVGTVVSLLIFSSVHSIFSAVTAAINEANNFFVALIPVAVGVTSLGGGTFAAGVQATGMSVTAAALSKLWGSAFTAISGLGLSMALISSYGGRSTATVSLWVKKTFSWFLGIATAAIGGTIALQTMVASARDSAAMRAARYAASGMIPVAPARARCRK